MEEFYRPQIVVDCSFPDFQNANIRNFNAGFIVQKAQSAGCFALQSRTNKQTAPATISRRVGDMSIAVPVAIVVLLSAQVYGAWVWPNYETEQKDKSEKADESSSDKDKSGKTDKSSSTTASKDKHHSRKQRME
jgi:hypothetical protein